MSVHRHACENCDAPKANSLCYDCHLWLCKSCDKHLHEPRCAASRVVLTHVALHQEDESAPTQGRRWIA